MRSELLRYEHVEGGGCREPQAAKRVALTLKRRDQLHQPRSTVTRIAIGVQPSQTKLETAEFWHQESLERDGHGLAIRARRGNRSRRRSDQVFKSSLGRLICELDPLDLEPRSGAYDHVKDTLD